MYKLPTEEEIRGAIYGAMKKKKSFSSLTSLREEVLKELKKLDASYTVSLKRTRILAARSGFIRVEVKKKHTNKKIENCPVCGGKLEKIRNMSLLGEKIVIGYVCKSCRYKSKVNELPLRYSFHFSR
ncbi:MAG: hypothetical protein FE047_01755 [Thermoplasmata archaeon]|nr:MAG: hypothetical protein FE047_01755 [Thermoplasmata archaeon]